MFKRLEKEDIQKIQELSIFKNLNNINFQKGWLLKVLEMGREIEVLCQKEKIPLPEVEQIKSKFGTLRFYFKDETNNQNLKHLSNKWHCDMSYFCEFCGSSNAFIGKYKGKWISLCKKCSEAVN